MRQATGQRWWKDDDLWSIRNPKFTELRSLLNLFCFFFSNFWIWEVLVNSCNLSIKPMDLSKLSFHRNLSIFPILLLTVSSDTEEVEEVEGQGKRLGRIVNPSTHFPLGDLLMGQVCCPVGGLILLQRHSWQTSSSFYHESWVFLAGDSSGWGYVRWLLWF